MSAGRQTKDIFFYIWGRYPGKQFRIKELFRKNFWKYNRDLIWHDTFGARLNRIFRCPIVGHIPTPIHQDNGQPHRPYCFKCMRYTDAAILNNSETKK
jgi:hypothetical protein